MCGICGKMYFDPARVVDERLLERMCQVMAYRGPDDQGIYRNQHVGLGHRRLSIIDLSTGRQPMGNEQQDIWIVFNGEIYNFPDLRKDLESEGCAFSTHSDTEVILHLYEKYGTRCVQYLRGMFAFAIWDKRQQRIFLARDRMGQKPLYYLLNNRMLVFASEAKSILQEPSYHPEVNFSAMSDYLTYQYVPAPETIFQGIRKLPPAHTLVCEQGRVTIERYWHLTYQPKIRLAEDDAVQAIETALLEAVKMRMISDVPLGAFLSGGIDSSLVVALMTQCSATPVKTFSIGFHEEAFNELPYARLMAERYGTEHHEFIVEPDAIDILPKLIRHFDEPFGDPSAIPTYYVAQLTGEHVKVALNGDGGDESFAGYVRYLGYRLVRYYQHIPRAIRSAWITPVLNWLTNPASRNRFPWWYDTLFRRVKYIHDLAEHTQDQLYIRRLTIFQNEPKSALLTDEVRKRVARADSIEYMAQYFSNGHVEHFLDNMLYADIMTYLPGDLLVKVDRMTMAHGLEGRSPFLDHHVMELAAALPPHEKLQGRTLKRLLKTLGKTWLPDAILSRKKQGFGVPLGQWFQHELRDMLEETFFSSLLVKDEILNGDVMQRIFQEHQSGKVNHHHRIWVLLTLELWYRMYIAHA